MMSFNLGCLELDTLPRLGTLMADAPATPFGKPQPVD